MTGAFNEFGMLPHNGMNPPFFIDCPEVSLDRIEVLSLP